MKLNMLYYLLQSTSDYNNQQSVKIYNDYKLGLSMALLIWKNFDEKNNFNIALFLLNRLMAQQVHLVSHALHPKITQVDPASSNSKLDIGLPIISSIYGSAFNTGFQWVTFLSKC